MKSDLPELQFSPPDFTIEDNPEYDDELRAALRLGYHNRKGIALAGAGSPAAALAEFDAAIKHCPTFGEAWYHRGLALGELNHFELAYESFCQAAFLTPLYNEALERIAILGPGLGRPAKILTPWADAAPPGAFSSAFHRMKGRLTRPTMHDKYVRTPEVELRRQLAADPNAAELADRMGLNLEFQYRPREAARFYRYALMLKPWMGAAAAHLSVCLENDGNLAEAYGVPLAAMNAGSTDSRLPGLALYHAILTADWTNYEDWLKRTVAAMKKNAAAACGHGMYFTDDPELHYRAARINSGMFEKSYRPMAVEFRRSAERPITLGYISADFREHPVARLIAELFELHDRKRFRVYGYGVLNDNKSSLAARVKKSFDKYRDISTLSPRAGAGLIVEDGVDILIDLTGNMANGPNSIIARRPAPVQVNYLGHPGTTGSAQTDYVIVDKTIVPPEQQKWFTEALVYLPECHQVNDRKRAVGDASRTRAEYGLPAAGVVYTSFNETKKLTPAAFDLWMRILGRVPGSILWLASQRKGTADNMRQRAASLGISSDRLVFAERVPEHADHMARYRQCDLYLDPLLYNGHTTASDALWAGCPVVATLGNSYQTRVAASLLQAAGLPELVARSPSAYEEIAVRIGLDEAYRTSLRARLEANRSTCTLFDTPRFTRHLEAAFERMWDAYVEGRAPASFEVQALPRV
ncbi:MAG: hypothetical protein AB7H70_01160 [Rhodospirillaceae bacterium]